MAALLGLAASPALHGGDIPRPAVMMSFQAPGGKAIDLRAYRGKVVALEFLLTTCPHCQDCSRMLQRLQTDFGPKGFQAVGAAVNDIAAVPEFVKNFALKFPVGFASRDQLTEFLQHPVLERLTFPQLVIVDRKGVVRFQQTGFRGDEEEKELRPRIEAMLNERAVMPRRRATAAAAKP